MQASISCFRSSSTFRFVSERSGRGLLDLDSVELRAESLIHLKDVSRLNVLGLASLDQAPLGRLAYGQRLQGSGQLSFGNKGLCLYLGIGQLSGVIEHHRDAHLVGVNAQDPC